MWHMQLQSVAQLEIGHGSPEIKRFCEMIVPETRKGVGFHQHPPVQVKVIGPGNLPKRDR